MRLSEKILTKRRKNTSVKFTLYLLDPERGDELEAAANGKDGEEAKQARREFIEASADMRFHVTRLSEVEVHASREEASAKLSNAMSVEGRKEVLDGDRGKFMIDYARAMWPKLARHVEKAEERGEDGEWRPVDAKQLQAILDSVSADYPAIQQFLVNEYLAAVSADETKAEGDRFFTETASAKGS